MKRIGRRTVSEEPLREVRFAISDPVCPLLGRKVRITFTRVPTLPPRVGYATVHVGNLTACQCESHLGNARCLRWILRHCGIELRVVKVLRRVGIETAHLQSTECKSDYHKLRDGTYLLSNMLTSCIPQSSPPRTGHPW